MTSQRWFPYRADPHPGRLRLFCVPPAGAAASVYRTWLPLLAPDIEVVPVQLPGREGRLDERPLTSAAELAGQLLGPVLDRAGERFALFGHSMGALLAHDLAHLLTAHGRPPEHLVVSAHVPPQLTAQRQWDIAAAEMSDVDLRGYLAEWAGTPKEILDQPELMEVVLPVLKADLILCQSYVDTPRPVLPMPVTALAGADDGQVSADELASWSARTSAGFRMRILPGGHDYLYDDAPTVLGLISAALLAVSER
jgi:surfactin synthase thioesterase subunit